MAYELEVPVRHRTLWPAFTDPARMARAVPGLTVDAVQTVDASAAPEGVSGDVVAGRLKLRVGAGTITYRGTALIAAAEPEAGTLDVAVDVAQARGDGALAGYLRITLTPSGDKTTVSIVPELELSGRALDFADGELDEAAAALAGQWLMALAEEFSDASVEAETAADVVAESEPESQPEAEVEVEAASEVEPAGAAETEPEAEPEAEPEPAAEGIEEPEEPEVPEVPEEPEETPVPVVVASSTPEPLLDDSLSDDPLETVWRGEYEKGRWFRIAAGVTVLLLIRRRRRRRRETRSLTS